MQRFKGTIWHGDRILAEDVDVYLEIPQSRGSLLDQPSGYLVTDLAAPDLQVNTRYLLTIQDWLRAYISLRWVPMFSDGTSRQLHFLLFLGEHPLA
jgi:hypothetical protein